MRLGQEVTEQNGQRFPWPFVSSIREGGSAGPDGDDTARVARSVALRGR